MRAQTSQLAVPVPTLVGTLSATTELGWLVRMAAMLFVTTLTAASAQLSVPLPFTPVPLSLQPLVVVLGGAVLGARLGSSSQLLYLALGVAGLPVFAASPILPQGAARLLGPTAGYLLAFPVAAWVVGWLAARGLDRRYLTSVAALAAGLGVILLGGVLWLAFAPPAPMGLPVAYTAGLLPFLLADAIKALMAGAILPALWRLAGWRSRVP